MRNTLIPLTLSVLVLAGTFSTGLMAQTSQEKGLEIAIEADTRDKDFGDVTSSLQMILTDQHGKQSIREMRNKTLEQENDGDKALIIFDNPRDVKGTAFLSFTHKADADDQWLFLPALKRIKRIASNNKAGPFMGSEFAFEDISSQEVEKYDYNYLRDEAFDGREHYVVERNPTDPKSGYTRQVVWIDKAEYRPWKIDFYDRKNVLKKTLNFSDYNQYLNKFWRANSSMMHNHQTGKKTELKFSNWSFQTGLNDRDFNKASLAKAR